MASRTRVVIGKQGLMFKPEEIDDSFTSMTKEEAANFLEKVNSSVYEWNGKGFLKIKLVDFKVPQVNNEEVEKIKQLRNGAELNGATISVGVQTIRKFREGIYKASISQDKQQLTIMEYNNLVKNELFPGKFESGIQFMEHVFTRLRNLKSGESLQVFYPGLTSRVILQGEKESGFDMDSIHSPLKDVITKPIPGFNCSCYSYFGVLGSCFMIHVDDLESQAINLVSFGNSKQWILIPKAYKDTLRALLVNVAPGNPKCFAEHKNLLVDPGYLRANGIPFSVVTQTPGEIVLVAKSTYHKGMNFCEGGNITIATATNLWLKDYLLDYSETKQTMIKACKCTKVSVSLTKKEQHEMDEAIVFLAADLREKERITKKRKTDEMEQHSNVFESSKRQRGDDEGDQLDNIN